MAEREKNLQTRAYPAGRRIYYSKALGCGVCYEENDNSNPDLRYGDRIAVFVPFSGERA
ncbi:MAG: hypothetical protein NC399_01735 [Muribaculum sp.]|nr:hypothetical protein [Muribaculum sp.]